VYAALILALLTPYLVFIQMHGGVVSYFRQASAWADRDRARASMKWPSLFQSSASAAGSSVVAAFERPFDRVKPTSIPSVVSGSFAAVGAGFRRIVTLVRASSVAWTFYIELLLPLLAVALLLLAPDGFRPTWPLARAKIGTVAALGGVLDAGFLRSPLEARLADPSVPHAILLAWLCTVAAVSIALPRGQRPSSPVRSLIPRLAIAGTVVALVFAVGCVLTKDLGGRLEKARLTHGPREAIERVRVAAAEIRDAWKLSTWESQRNRPDLIALSLYLNACTEPADRILVESYVPQVVALARRGFAGGQADVRLGLFDTRDAQQLTVSRLQRQSVPVILLDSSGAFHADFPVVAAYVDAHYRRAGMRVFDGRFPFDLYVRRDARPRGVYRPFGWPCYGPGRVTDS